MGNKVVICGPVPEPVGGVSIHIARLSKCLEKLNFQVSLIDESPTSKSGIFNIRSFGFLKYCKLIASADVVHIHSSVRIFLFIHLIAASALCKPIVVTLHSWRETALKNLFWRHLFKLLSVRLIFVSNEIQQRVNLPGLIKEAYIHPDLENESELPEEVASFINANRGSGACICVSNAYRLARHQGECLYGLDMCLEVMNHISLKSSNKLAMVYVIANYDGDEEVVERYEKYIKDHNLQDSFLLFKGALSFAKLLMAADISVRATNTDGDALSVRESLNLGCLTIASDCVERPDGTVLFKVRDNDDLEKVIVNAAECLHENNSEKRAIIEDCVDSIVNEYRLCKG